MPLRITPVAAAALIAAALVAACAAPAPEPSLARSTPVPPPGIASEADGRYTLTLSLPKDTWAAGEDIQGQAILSLEPGPDTVVSGSGGLLGFSFAEVDGSRVLGPAFTADCARHPLPAGSPITSPLRKSGGWSDDQPDADFYRQFFQQPGIRLPAGDWDVSVVTSFYEGQGCTGAPHDLHAVVRIHVTDGPAPSP